MSVYSPVERSLRDINRGNFNTLSPNHVDQAESLLRKVFEAGYLSQEATYSCWDYAATFTDDYAVQMKNNGKIRQWESLRSIPQVPEISLELDPVFYAGIAGQRKRFEGRALDLANDRQYYGLRENSRMTFTVSGRNPDELEAWGKLGLNPKSMMSGFIGRVLFAPTVHAMFELTGQNGRDFQPQIEGDDPLLVRLKRAGVYYEFPNYPERIKANGFVALEFAKMHWFGVQETEDEEGYMWIISS
jgi:hypothetical protein